MSTFSSELRTQRAALEAEVGRLEELLSANPDWRDLRALESGLSDGLYRGVDRDAMNLKRAQIHRALSENRVYSAYNRLREAVELMREEEANTFPTEYGVDDTDTSSADQRPQPSLFQPSLPQPTAPPREPFKTRVKVKIHSAPPTGVASDVQNVQPKADDLKAIRGISSKIEEQLHGLGVKTWSQISNWRKTDVQTLSAALGLDNQISRQNWIEQAAALCLKMKSDEPVETIEAPEATATNIDASPEPAGRPPRASSAEIEGWVTTASRSIATSVLSISTDQAETHAPHETTEDQTNGSPPPDSHSGANLD
ncbi:MAG: hypothetical protein AAFO75_08675, partial [Pseudomonadota bacterium]